MVTLPHQRTWTMGRREREAAEILMNDPAYADIALEFTLFEAVRSWSGDGVSREEIIETFGGMFFDEFYHTNPGAYAELKTILERAIREV